MPPNSYGSSTEEIEISQKQKFNRNILSMCELLGRRSVCPARMTCITLALAQRNHPHHNLNERTEDEEGLCRGQGNWISRPPDLNRGNGKHQSDRNQATGRKLQVGQLDSRTGLGCLTIERKPECDSLCRRKKGEILEKPQPPKTQNRNPNPNTRDLKAQALNSR